MTEHNTQVKRTWENTYNVTCSCGWVKVTGGVSHIARRWVERHQLKVRQEMGLPQDFQMSLWAARVAYTLTFEREMPGDMTYADAALSAARAWQMRTGMDEHAAATHVMVMGQMLAPQDIHPSSLSRG